MSVENIVQLELKIKGSGKQVLKSFAPKEGFTKNDKKLFASGAEIVKISYGRYRYKRTNDVVGEIDRTSGPMRFLQYELIE